MGVDAVKTLRAVVFYLDSKGFYEAFILASDDQESLCLNYNTGIRPILRGEDVFTGDIYQLPADIICRHYWKQKKELVKNAAILETKHLTNWIVNDLKRLVTSWKFTAESPPLIRFGERLRFNVYTGERLSSREDFVFLRLVEHTRRGSPKNALTAPWCELRDYVLRMACSPEVYTLYSSSYEQLIKRKSGDCWFSKPPKRKRSRLEWVSRTLCGNSHQSKTYDLKGDDLVLDEWLEGVKAVNGQSRRACNRGSWIFKGCQKSIRRAVKRGLKISERTRLFFKLTAACASVLRSGLQRRAA